MQGTRCGCTMDGQWMPCWKCNRARTNITTSTQQPQRLTKTNKTHTVLFLRQAHPKNLFLLQAVCNQSSNAVLSVHQSKQRGLANPKAEKADLGLAAKAAQGPMRQNGSGLVGASTTAVTHVVTSYNSTTAPQSTPQTTTKPT